MASHTFDAQALRFTAELANDRVLNDPSNDDIVLAVEEFMYGVGTTRRFSSRLRRGVVSIYETVEHGSARDEGITDEDIEGEIRRISAIWGLN